MSVERLRWRCPITLLFMHAVQCIGRQNVFSPSGNSIGRHFVVNIASKLVIIVFNNYRSKNPCLLLLLHVSGENMENWEIFTHGMRLKCSSVKLCSTFIPDSGANARVVIQICLLHINEATIRSGT